jgi:5,5'-dehydrodivanillate O-demethylase
MMHTLAWRVPIDDETHCSFSVQFVPVTGELAERCKARRDATPMQSVSVVYDLAGAVLRGEMSLDDIADHRGVMVNVEDYVTQVGQGAIADRTIERLRASDAGLVLLRQVWMRELKALAEGRPLTGFVRPPELRSDKQYAAWTHSI